MLSHPCGPKRRRYDIPCALCRQPPHGRHISDKLDLWRDALGRKWNGKHSCWKRGSENNRGHVGPQRKGTRRNRRGWRRIFVVWFGVFDNHLFGARLQVGRPQENFGDMRDNTPKKHGVGYVRLTRPMPCQSRLWQGIGRVRRTGCVPMWWHRSITFPIDNSNNKVGCNAVRLVNAFSPDSKAFYSYLWRRQPQNATEGLCQWMHGAQVQRCCQRPSFSLTRISLSLSLRPWWTHHRKTRES